MPTVELDLSNSTEASIDENRLKEHLALILRRLKSIGTVIIEINIVKDAKIQKLNYQFLQNNRPTDVLSFNNPEYTVGGSLPLGSLVVSAETAAKQAKQASISLQEEVEMLAGHGLLHLLGFNHQ